MTARNELLKLACILGFGFANAPIAFAQDGPLVEILPVGEVIGDGTTSVLGHVIALDGGAPVTGLKLKMSATSGEASEWTEVAPGIYQFRYRPATVDTRQTATLTARGRIAGGDNVQVTAEVQVLPAPARRIEATANPSEIVLGTVGEATLSFRLDGPSGQPLDAADLLVRATSGEVVNVTHMGGGRFTARYVAPRVNYPHLAIVTVADRRYPDRVLGAVTIPLQGKVDYPVQAAPNATVLLRLSGRDFGPVKASPQGRASVPIVVPPGVSSATLISVVGATTTEETLDLRVPETLRLKFFPLPDALPASAGDPVPVHVAVMTPDGRPDSGANVDITATAGRVGAVRHVANGIYEAMFTPPEGRVQMAATLQATIQGSTLQTDSVEVRLVPARAGSLALSAEPATLSADTSQLRVFARVLGTDDTGMAERVLGFRAVGAEPKGPPADLRGGDYRADFAARGNTAVTVYGMVATAPSGNPLRHVLVVPGDEVIAADGTSSAALSVITTDAWGYPVPNVEVKLSLVSGDGALPTQVTTSANGYAEVFYTAGRSTSLVRVRAEAGDHLGAAAILQASNVTLDLPTSGTDEVRRLHDAWDGIYTTLTVPREGAAVAVSTTPEVPAAPAAAIASLAVRAEPSTVAPGGTVTLRVEAKGANGVGVSGQSLEFFTTSGRFGIVSDLGGGVYQTTLQVPDDASRAVKVSVLAGGGTANSILEIPIGAASEVAGTGWGGAQEGPAWGALEEPAAAVPETTEEPTTTEEPGPVATPEPKPKPEPRPTSDRPWFRARASGVISSYAYSQSPSDDPGPLIPETLAVGGDGGSAATPGGFELAARGWLPPVPYLGFNVGFRYTRYGISSDAFSDVARDSLIAAVVEIGGRVPFEVGANQVHVGVRAGYRYDDFIVFKGCLEPGCTVEYEPLGTSALSVSGEVGAEIGSLYLLGSYSHGFANFTVPYSSTFDANVGYNILPNLFVDAGFTGVWRNLSLEGKDSGFVRGDLHDSQYIGKIGVGFSL